MKEEQKLSEYTKKVWGIADAIALVLLVESAFMYGFAGIIFRLRK